MIVIISGTNRPGSNTHKVAARIEAIYQTSGTIIIDGKMKGDSLKVIVPEVIGNVLNGLGKNGT